MIQGPITSDMTPVRGPRQARPGAAAQAGESRGGQGSRALADTRGI